MCSTTTSTTLFGVRSLLKLFSVIFITCLFTLLWCEFLIYYVHLYAFCQWPQVANDHSQTQQDQQQLLDVLVLSDTHLLGNLRGHWFDKLRREWQMYRSFQTAIQLFQPKVVFILGDIFDEGQWASPKDFALYVRRFEALFATPEYVQLYVISGNHDIGFHDWITPYLSQRFDRAMNTSTVDYFSLLNGAVHFVRLNSMAMEGDGCSLCNEAEWNLNQLSHYFDQLRSKYSVNTNSLFHHPVLLTHFPLYRKDESICTEVDSIFPEQKFVPNREKLDTFSVDASRFILDKLKPRLILNGHVHHSCVVNHTIVLNDDDRDSVHPKKMLIPEWTVASFSWRNKVNPSFLLLRLTATEHYIAKCFLPHESMVIGTYVIIGLALVIPLLGYIFYHTIIKHKRD